MSAYLRILGGKVIKAENPCYIKLANTWLVRQVPRCFGRPEGDRVVGPNFMDFHCWGNSSRR